MKYRNIKVKTAEGQFDSKKEFERWNELKLMEDAGVISDLKRQVKYTLVPPQEAENGRKERAVVYIADFVYKEAGKPVVEDAKGVKTRDYIIKRKLMLYIYGIAIQEV